MLWPQLSTIKRRRAGFTLIELMVALVVSAVAALAIYGAFNGLSSAISQTKSQDNTWQQARTAMTLLTQAIEGAGYGLPMNLCDAGVYTSTNGQNAPLQPDYTISPPGGTQGLFVVPVDAALQTAALPFSYVPASGSTYALTTVTGGGPFGAAPVAHITTVPSTTAATFFVDNGNLLAPYDMFLVPIANGHCIMGQITSIPSTNHVVANSNASSGGSIYNAPRGFSGADPGVTTTQLVNAGLIDLGNGGFSIKNFFIQDHNGAGVPSLYMQVYQAGSGSQPAQAQPQAILVARGVLDMQIQFGYGLNRTVTTYVSPTMGPPANMTAGDLLTVKLALLVRSTRYNPGQHGTAGGATPSISVMGANYIIPTGLPAGQTQDCVSGNCNQYIYRVFETVIPVRNDIWAE